MNSSNANALAILIQDYYTTKIIFDTHFELQNQDCAKLILNIQTNLNMLANRIFIKIGIDETNNITPEESEILKNASFMKRPIDAQILAKQIRESRDKKNNTI